MLQDHVEANRLIDLAELKDREGYAAKLQELRMNYGKVRAANIADNARRQIQALKDHRFWAWRIEWVQSKEDKT